MLRLLFSTSLWNFTFLNLLMKCGNINSFILFNRDSDCINLHSAPTPCINNQKNSEILYLSIFSTCPTFSQLVNSTPKTHRHTVSKSGHFEALKLNSNDIGECLSQLTKYLDFAFYISPSTSSALGFALLNLQNTTFSNPRPCDEFSVLSALFLHPNKKQGTNHDRLVPLGSTQSWPSR